MRLLSAWTCNCRPMVAYLKPVRTVPAYALEDRGHMEEAENLPWCGNERITSAVSNGACIARQAGKGELPTSRKVLLVAATKEASEGS